MRSRLGSCLLALWNLACTSNTGEADAGPSSSSSAGGASSAGVSSSAGSSAAATSQGMASTSLPASGSSRASSSSVAATSAAASSSSSAAVSSSSAGAGSATSAGAPSSSAAVLSSSAAPSSSSQPVSSAMGATSFASSSLGAGSSASAGSSSSGGPAYPALGVYTVDVDGTGLTLLVNPGTRQLTHVRVHPSQPWATATRYNDDADGNGLAMEVEANTALTYSNTEIVVFPLANPSTVTVLAGGIPGKIAANSSWTADGKVIHLQQDDPVDPNFTRIKRVSFGALPAVSSVEAVPTPVGLFIPVDPHQAGPSDASGSIVFAAFFQHPTGWMRPVWRMSAAGTTNLAQAQLVGCPVCATGCCAWPSLAEVLGSNDPRLDHAGNDVMFMQQSPDVFFVLPPVIYPYRAWKKPAGAPQLDLTPPGTAGATSLSFADWRGDDGEVVYWSMEIQGTALKQHIFRMAPDGTGRVQVPLPAQLCPSHPGYLDANTLVFTAWRCGGANCTCDAAALSP